MFKLLLPKGKGAKFIENVQNRIFTCRKGSPKSPHSYRISYFILSLFDVELLATQVGGMWR